MPAGCAGECSERGTYRLDGASHVVVLEDASTHQARSLALDILEIGPVGRALVKSVRPLDLVDPGVTLTQPGGETTKERQQLVQGEGQLSGTISLLLRVKLEGQSLVQNQR